MVGVKQKSRVGSELRAWPRFRKDERVEVSLPSPARVISPSASTACPALSMETIWQTPMKRVYIQIIPRLSIQGPGTDARERQRYTSESWAS